MSDNPALAQTRQKLHEVTENIDAAERANNNSLRALIAALAVAGWLLYMALQKQAPLWGFLVPLPVVVAAGRWHGKNRDKWLRLIRLRKFHERTIARTEDQWAGNGSTGEEFRIAHHVYDLDLQVLGMGSLFELMCSARTGIGRRKLSEYLLSPCDTGEAKARQAAVRELMPQGGLRERIELLGKFSFQESTWSVFSDWVAVPAIASPGWVRIAALVSSIALCSIVVGAFLTASPLAKLPPMITPFAATLIGAAWFYRTRTKSLNEAASRVGVDVGVVREGIELLAGAQFQSAKLLAIQRKVTDGQAAARSFDVWNA